MHTKRHDDGNSIKHCSIADNIHHGTMLTDEYAGEIICSRCGVVLEEKIQSEAKPKEKDGYSNGDTSSNSGSSTYLSSHHSLIH